MVDTQHPVLDRRDRVLTARVTQGHGCGAWEQSEPEGLRTVGCRSRRGRCSLPPFPWEDVLCLFESSHGLARDVKPAFRDRWELCSV